MTFLDTVDGKLARITLKSSKLGNVFDHGIDLVHPPFWYWAWAAGLQNGPHALSEPTLLLMLAVIVAGYVLQRGIEGIALRSEERRGGKGCVSTFRSWWSPDHKKKKQLKI